MPGRSWRSPVTPGTSLPFGASHGVEIPFVWDTLDALGTQDLVTNGPAELARVMHARWIEFARSGELADWPVYDPDTRPVMAFAKDNTAANEIVQDPWSGERRLWDDVAIPTVH
jgi:para-nitrobenzyl esterase